MLDDLRNTSDFQDEEEPQPVEEETSQPGAPSVRRSRSKGPFLGMTPVQRFFLALMVFMMVCVLSIAVLVLTNSIYLPFF